MYKPIGQQQTENETFKRYNFKYFFKYLEINCEKICKAL